jgi:FkbM family methyltransferase
MNLMKKCRYGLMIYNNKDVWVGKSIEKYGEFSESEVQVFRDAIQPGSVVLDVGANIGCHTVAIARIVGENGFVFSYEPERTNFNTLAGNVALNNLNNVYVFQKAIGETTRLIPVPELDYNQTTNFGGLSLVDQDYSGCPNYPIQLTTIDDQNFLRLDFIKIDIEGMEKEALQGAKETIEKLKPILYVENDRPDKSESLIEQLKSLGYICYKHLAPLYNPSNFFGNKEDEFFVPNENGGFNQIISENIFAHHKDNICPIDVQKFSMTEI